jgi:aminomethyltransferase
MRGKDALSLLQRLSTNDMLKIGELQGNQTVLTTPIGRIIDLLHVLNLGDEVWVFTSATQGPAVFRHLKQNIFFNDAVTLTPAARTHRQLAIYGAGADALVSDLFHGSAVGALPRWHALRGEVGMATRIQELGGSGWRIVWPAEQPLPVSLATLPQMDDATLNVWQIEAGVPAFGSELSTDYIPLEAGLESAISFAKGCYVGQEIIARMESRGRRAKSLERVGLSQLIEAPVEITNPAGQVMGIVTRAVRSPRQGPIAMAYISSKASEDTPLHAGGATLIRGV